MWERWRQKSWLREKTGQPFWLVDWVLDWLWGERSEGLQWCPGEGFISVNQAVCSSSVGKCHRALTLPNVVPASLSNMEDNSFWGRPLELSGNYTDLFHKWIDSKLDFYTNWLKGKLLNCQARALHSVYELPWFIFPREGPEKKSFPSLLRSSWRITHGSIRARRTIPNNSIEDLIEYLTQMCILDILLSSMQFGFAKSIWFLWFVLWVSFSCELIIEILNIPTYRTKSF